MADKNAEKPLSYTQDSMRTREPEFPELTRMQAIDRQHHIQKCLEMGMSREEAERHADEHTRGRLYADGHE